MSDPTAEGTAPLRRDADAILAVELPQALRGYRIREVDALLGELALQVAAMQEELDRARSGPVPPTSAPSSAPGSTGADALPVGAPRTTDVTAVDGTEGTAPDDAGGAGDAIVPVETVETVPIDDERPREALGVASAARRRALLPSAVLTVLAAVALAVGWALDDRRATLAAIMGSGLALVGVAIAVWRTRGRSARTTSD